MNARRGIVGILSLALLLPGVRLSAQEPSLYDLGTAARKKGDHKAAKETFEKLLKQNPRSTGALEGLALACMALGQHDQAIAYLKKWDSIEPNSPYVAGLLERAKRARKAQAAPSPKPEDAVRALYEVGAKARERGDHKAAREAFLKILEREPNNAGALEGASLACLSLGLYDEALRHLERWNELSPENPYIEGLIERAKRAGAQGQAAPKPAAPAEPEKPSYYTLGMQARRLGQHQQAKEYFAKMLAESPDSGGALEGMSLACLSLGQYAEAREHLEKWSALSPRNVYILSLLVRAQRGMNDDEAVVRTSLELVEAGPDNIGLRRRVDGTMQDQAGLFAKARISKSLVTEELNSRNPQRIVYESRTGGARARVKAQRDFNVLAGAEFSEDAQRNDRGGFIYYDVLEQTYWMGLEYKPRSSRFLSAEYGQAVMSNIHGSGFERRTLFSRVRLDARWHWLAVDFSLHAERSPRFFRGSGGNNFFALLRDDSARMQGEFDLLGLSWRARAGVDDMSEGTTLKNWSILGSKEYGAYLLQPAYSHGQQDFFGATPAGRIQYILTDRYALRARRLVDESHLLSASAGYTYYADANRAADLSAEAIGWLPWFRELSGGYRFLYNEYLASPPGYRNTNETAHYLLAYWQHRYGTGRGFWTRLGYEHGFLWDATRRRHDGNTWLAEVEWYLRRDLSLLASGRYGTTTVRDKYHSAALQFRYSF